MTRSGAAALHFSADHPAFPGHFPGRPMVPGVLILDAALRAMALDQDGAMIETVKFSAPFGPEQTLALTWAETSSGRIAFEGRIAGTRALSGQVRPAPGRGLG